MNQASLVRSAPRGSTVRQVRSRPETPDGGPAEFAQVVAHELKAPLRAAHTLAEWLSLDHAHRLDANGQELVRQIQERLRAMDSLVERLLAYSCGVPSPAREWVDMQAVLARAVEMVAPPPHVTVHVEQALPVVRAAHTPLQVVLQNLVGNAVKFMDKPQGVIRVGCQELAGVWRFWVTDNGRGIPEQHFQRIFRMFESLRPPPETSSHGMGLAVARRLVEHLGGKLWVESAVGLGSTFYFTLPRTDSSDADDPALVHLLECPEGNHDG